MDDHRDSAKKGKELGKFIAARLAADDSVCPHCYSAATAVEMLGQCLAASDDEVEVLEYITAVAEAIYRRYVEERKKAGHESPPVAPDKSKMN